MNYILTTESELYHHGVKGMKWGVRRYQNADGTLTAAGKKRYDKELAKANKEVKKLKEIERTKIKMEKLESIKAANAAKKKALKSKDKNKSVKEMTDEELRSKINRIQLERQYVSMQAQPVSKGKTFMKAVMSTVIVPAAADVGRQIVKSLLVKGTNKFIESDELKVHTNNKKK